MWEDIINIIRRNFFEINLAYEDWLILLQVDSFEGKDFQLNLMDVGVLDFLISPSDLKQHSFDNVRAIVLSS